MSETETREAPTEQQQFLFALWRAAAWRYLNRPPWFDLDYSQMEDTRTRVVYNLMRVPPTARRHQPLQTSMRDDRTRFRVVPNGRR